MRIEFDIPDEKVQNFSLDAKAELTRQANRIANEIVDEASRVEASRRLPETNSEVTQSNVKEVATQPRMVLAKKNTVKSKIIQVVAFGSTLVAGSLLDTSKFTETNHVIWFIVMSFLAIGTTVYLTFNQENNG
jgi:DhnA family fructose-bisphosphate aldolase class Ia